MKVILLLALISLVFSVQIFKTRAAQKPTSLGYENNYPIRLAWVNRSPYWYGDNIAKAWGVPGFAPPHIYNYIVLTFWSCGGAPKDMAMLWRDAGLYFGDQSSFGKTSQ